MTCRSGTCCVCVLRVALFACVHVGGWLGGFGGWATRWCSLPCAWVRVRGIPHVQPFSCTIPPVFALLVIIHLGVVVAPLVRGAPVCPMRGPFSFLLVSLSLPLLPSRPSPPSSSLHAPARGLLLFTESCGVRCRRRPCLYRPPPPSSPSPACLVRACPLLHVL